MKHNIDFNEMLKHYKPVDVQLDLTTYDVIDKIAKATFKTRQTIVYTLMQTALTYNFNANLEYLLCETQNKAYSQRKTKPLCKKIKIYINNKYLPTLDKIQYNAGTNGISATIRFLITVALEHDYNKDFIFSKPTPIDLSSYAPIGKDNISDFILLDII